MNGSRSLAIVALAAAVALLVGACGSDAEIPPATVDGGGGVGARPDGRGLCNAEGFCFENPLAHGFSFEDAWVAAPNDVWAVAYPDAILHFDGTTWTQVALETSGATLHTIWGSGPNDIWVGGYEYRGDKRQLIFHYDGKAWSLSFSGPSETDGFDHLNKLWGSGPTDVWAVGDRGTLLHYDGASWSSRPALGRMRLDAIGGTSASDVWVLPADLQRDPSAWHFDGTKWSSVSTGAPATLESVWASGPSDVWVSTSELDDALGGPTLRHFDGVTWTTSDAPWTIRSMWGSGASDIWGVGESGLVHYDGTRWTVVTLDTPKRTELRWVSGRAANDVWAGGWGPSRDSGALLHYDGTKWSQVAEATVTTGDLSSVWAASSRDVWAVGSEIVHRTERGWERVDAGTNLGLAAVHGSAPNDVWAVGSAGTALHYDGTAWAPVPSATTAWLRGVWSGAINDAWAVGNIPSDAGVGLPVALHFDGKSWSSVPIGTDESELVCVRGIAANDVWAASRTAVFHYDGSSWTKVPDVRPDAYGSASAWASAANDVWIGSWHYDGTAWSLTPDNPGGVATWGRSAKDVWTLNRMGDVEHFDGSRWQYFTTVTATQSISGTTSDLWVVGMRGAILHKQL